MKHFKSTALLALFTVLLTANFAFAQKLKAEDVLAKHLASIGTETARAAAKNQIIVGEAVIKFISRRDPAVVGRIVMASDGAKNFLGMSLNSTNYPQEKFTFDGKDSNVGFVKDGIRSVLGNFVSSNGKLLSESLFGGVLNTSWVLRDTTNKKAKLSFDGIKKINDKEVYALSYLGKVGDVDITLYFDKEDFRHVRTEYKRTSSAAIGTRPEQSSGFSETRLRLTEDFSDFKTEGGLTLPHGYHILYSTTGGANGTTEIDWTFKLTNFAFNQKFADNTFGGGSK